MRLIQNAILNRVEDKVEFFVSDSVTPFAEADRNSLETLVGQTNFILANPPSSDGEELKLRETQTPSGNHSGRGERGEKKSSGILGNWEATPDEEGANLPGSFSGRCRGVRFFLTCPFIEREDGCVVVVANGIICCCGQLRLHPETQPEGYA